MKQVCLLVARRAERERWRARAHQGTVRVGAGGAGGSSPTCPYLLEQEYFSALGYVRVSYVCTCELAPTMSLSLDHVVWVVPCSVAPAVTTTSPTGRTGASVSVEVCVRAL